MSGEPNDETMIDDRDIVKPDEHLWEQLSNLIHVLQFHNQITWVIFTLFIAANAILATAVHAASEMSFTLPALHVPICSSLVISVSGVIGGILWFIVQHDAVRHAVNDTARIAELEAELTKTDRFRVSALLRQGRLVKYVILGSPVLMICGWTIGLLGASCKGR